MGVQYPNVLHQDQILHVVSQSASEFAAETFKIPTTSTRMHVLESEWTRNKGASVDDEANPGTRSRRALFEDGMIEASGRIKKYLRTNGDPGSGGSGPEQDHQLWYSALGGYTQNASSEVYTLGSSQSPRPLCATAHFNQILQYGGLGLIIAMLKINIAKGEKPTVEFSGPMMDRLRTTYGAAVGSGGFSMSATSGTCKNSKHLVPGSLVAIGASTNSGAGHTISTVNYSTHAITWVGGLTEGVDEDDPIVPFVPTAAASGSVVTGVSGSFSLDGGSSAITDVLSMELTVDNMPIASDEALRETIRDFTFDDRDVKGKIRVRGHRSRLEMLADMERFVAQDLYVQVGASPNRYIFDLPSVKLLPNSHSFAAGGDGAAELEFDFQAFPTSGDNELTVTRD